MRGRSFFDNREARTDLCNRAGSLGLSTEFEHEARSTKCVSVLAPSGAIGDRLRSPSSILQDAPSRVSRGGAPLPPILARAPGGAKAEIPRKISHSLSTCLSIWEALKPVTRCGSGELAASPMNDPVPKARRHQRTAPGMPPVRRHRRLRLHGTRAERDLRVRGRYGSAGVWGREPWKSQASQST
jgi:hypothetical protein